MRLGREAHDRFFKVRFTPREAIAARIPSMQKWLKSKTPVSATTDPQDDPRMKISKEIAHVKNLEQYVKPLPTELIFNVDELGS
jgi:hypothetical protein